MRRLGAVLLIGALSVSTPACTPKPPSAQPVAESALEAIAAGDTSEFPEYFDKPDEAAEVVSATTRGMQAEDVSVEDLEVTHDGARATASYRLVWHLPGEREFSSDAQMILTRAADEWTATWQPTILTPRLGAHQHLELRALEAPPASVVSSDGAELMRPGVVHRVLVRTDEMTDATGTVDTLRAAGLEIDEKTLRDAEGTYSVGTSPDPVNFEGHPEILVNDEAAMVSTDPGFAPDTMSRVGAVVADRLQGRNGWQVAVVNEQGALLGELESHEPDNASAITVSLDHDVQRAADTAVDELGERQAVIVAIRPSTGQILAVAQNDAADAAGNIALMGQYPPGSVFKIVTAAAGGIPPDQIVGCPGSAEFYGRVVTNYNGFSLGDVPLERAFAQSCNTTFAEISTGLEPGRLQDVAKQFGLGVDYSVAGLDTLTGSVPRGDTPLERTEAGYGQGLDLVSPFGMALVSATAASGRTPLPVLIDGEETAVDTAAPPPDPRAIADVRQMMRAVVTSGTAAGMSAGGEIHGKTGEAEVNEGSHAWFTGYRDDLAFATLVVYGGGSTISVNATNRFLTTLDELKAPAS